MVWWKHVDPKMAVIGLVMGFLLTISAIFVIKYTEFLFGVVLLWILIPVFIAKIIDRLRRIGKEETEDE